MIDPTRTIPPEDLGRHIRTLESEVTRLKLLLAVAAKATASGFEEILARLERLEGFVFGEPVDGFDGAGEAETPPAIIPSGTSA